jgi:hypothetical protein
MEKVMTPNCLLEAKNMTGMVENQRIYIGKLMMAVLGDKLESETKLVCNQCMLFDDCRPLPIFEEGKFVGVRSDI